MYHSERCLNNAHAQGIDAHALVHSIRDPALATVLHAVLLLVNFALRGLLVVHNRAAALELSIVIAFEVLVLQRLSLWQSWLQQDARGAFQVLHAHEE